MDKMSLSIQVREKSVVRMVYSCRVLCWSHSTTWNGKTFLFFSFPCATIFIFFIKKKKMFFFLFLEDSVCELVFGMGMQMQAVMEDVPHLQQKLLLLNHVTLHGSFWFPFSS